MTGVRKDKEEIALAYYAITFYKEDREYGYYIFDSNTSTVKRIPNKVLRGNPHIVNDIINADLSGYSNLKKPILKSISRGGYNSRLNTALVEDGCVIRDRKTLVYIDFIKGMCGLVSYNGEKTNWIPINKLEELSLIDKYNNLAYNKKSGKLLLKNYHVIGEEYIRDIWLRGLVGKKVSDGEQAKKVSEKGAKLVEGETGVKKESTGTKEITIEKEPTAVVEKKENEKVSWLLKKNKKEADNCKLVTQKEFYEEMLLMMRDDDVITIPRWVLREVGFKLKINLNSSMDLSKRTSLGSISINNSPMIAIVGYDDSVDYVKLQIKMSSHIDKNKDYSVENIRNNFKKWKTEKQFISV